MTHTKHRKRRERADREARATLPGYEALRRALAAPLHPDDAYWLGRRGWPKTEDSARRLVEQSLAFPVIPSGRTGRAG